MSHTNAGQLFFLTIKKNSRNIWVFKWFLDICKITYRSYIISITYELIATGFTRTKRRTHWSVSTRRWSSRCFIDIPSLEAFKLQHAQNQLESTLHTPAHTFWFGRAGEGLWVRVSNKAPGAVDAAGPETTLSHCCARGGPCSRGTIPAI